MKNIINWFRIDRSDLRQPSVLILIGANLLPLLGALFLDWKVFPILLLFWIENIILGILNVVKMLLASPASAINWGSKLFIVPFFILHYGVFTVVHGAFIFILFGGMASQDSIVAWSDFSRTLSDPYLIVAALGLAASHLFSLVNNYIGKGEYKNAGLTQLMFQPYGRVVIMHITILAGGFLLMALGSPVGGLILLVALKTFIDILTHVRQHRRT